MAATLKHQAQKALSLYRYMGADHPLYAAYSDYRYAVAHALPCQDEKRRLKRELALEAHITRVLERTTPRGLPQPPAKRGAA